MCLASTSIICSVKKIEEGAYFNFSYKKAVIMAKGDRKRAKSGSFKLATKFHQKGKKMNTNLWQAPVQHQTDYSSREVTLLIVEISESDCDRGLGQQKMDLHLEIELWTLRKWSRL